MKTLASVGVELGEILTSSGTRELSLEASPSGTPWASK
jgi:hypothetical protein